MKKEEQVCTLDQGKKLEELGVKADAIFFWYRGFSNVNGPAGTLVTKEWCDERCVQNAIYPAYTVAELGEMLPHTLFGEKMLIVSAPSEETEYLWCAMYVDVTEALSEVKEHWADGDTMAEALAQLLIYLLTNKLIDVNKINKV